MKKKRLDIYDWVDKHIYPILFFVVIFGLIALQFQNDRLQLENNQLKGQINNSCSNGEESIKYNFVVKEGYCPYVIKCKEENITYTYQGDDCRIYEQRINHLGINCEVMK